MIIRNDFNTTEASVLAAYGYALTQRRIYNQTNGQQGAYVVATNASWGVNDGQAANAVLPIKTKSITGNNVIRTANNRRFEFLIPLLL